MAERHRRQVLRGLGAASIPLLAGCSGGNSPSLSEDSFSVIRRDCGDEHNSGEIQIDGNTVSVSGTVVPAEACGEPAMETYISEAQEGVNLIVDIVLATESDCPDCDRYYTYSGEVRVEGANPQKVKLFHTAGPAESSAVAVTEGGTT